MIVLHAGTWEQGRHLETSLITLYEEANRQPGNYQAYGLQNLKPGGENPPIGRTTFTYGVFHRETPMHLGMMKRRKLVHFDFQSQSQ